MRRRVPGCGAVVCAAWIAAAVALVHAGTVISWQSAASYVGDVVTVEGDVVQGRLEADTCVLEFAPGDDKAFRVVLLIPLLTDLPLQPQRLYEGKRVRVSGNITSWKGRPEMIVRGPGAIEVVGVAAGAPATAPAAPPPSAPPTTQPRRTTVTPTTTPPPTAPPATLPPPQAAPAPVPVAPSTTLPPYVPTTTLPPAAPPTTLPPAAPAAPPPTTPDQPEEAPRLPRRVDPCDTAHERWRRAAAQADARAAELSRCLRAGSYRCRATASAMAPALSELEWAEQQVEAACP
jgi:hypothetical protein